MSRMRAFATLLVWAASLSAALLFLHRTPTAGTQTDGSAYVIAAIRYAALGVGWYLAVSTMVASCAHLLRSPAWIDLADRVTARPINRLCRLAAGTAVAAAGLVPSIAAAQDVPPPPVMTWVDDSGPPAAPSPQPAPLSSAAAGAPAVTQREQVVAPGDHLWSLAERRLAEALGRPPAESEISRYWLRVVRSNADGGYLRNRALPDLLFPGDRVVLPPP